MSVSLHDVRPRTAGQTGRRIRLYQSAEWTTAGNDDGDDAGLQHTALLPRLNPVLAKTLNRLYAGGSIFEFQLGAAVWQVSWDPDPAPLAMPRRYHFLLGDAPGHLVLDPLGERMLLGEKAADVVPPDLRNLLLADALEAVFPLIERHTGQPFEFVTSEDQSVLAAAPQDAYAYLLLREQTSQTAYRCAIQFDDARHFDLLCPQTRPQPPHTGGDWSWIPVPLGFRLGATTLKLAELVQIAPGDIVRIDTWRSAGKGIALTASLPGTARYAIAAHAVDTRIIVDRLEEKTLATSKTEDSTAERIHPDGLLDDIEALEVALSFELGTHSVTLGELRSLRPGHAIELAQPLQRSEIRILANGRSVGTGYLIALGDKLGIRVSEFAKNDDV